MYFRVSGGKFVEIVFAGPENPLGVKYSGHPPSWTLPYNLKGTKSKNFCTDADA
jgi:hypothetical protein